MKKIDRWRRLDNTAKIFSLEAESNINIFRYSVVMKKNVDKEKLIEALNKTLENYLSFKVKVCSGFFWNYFEYNSKEVIVKEEEEIPCQFIDFKENNDYLFRVTYYKNKINLDIFHVLTDGNGAAIFLKALIGNYLDLINDGCFSEKIEKNPVEYQDEYLRNFDKKDKAKHNTDLAFQIKGNILNNVNNTYHYILDVSEVKKISKENGVSITEYLTALYIYAMYTSIYDGRCGKEIIITVPIDLRKYYGVETLSNFFACMDINPRLVDNNVVDFDEALALVHEEFKNKLTEERVKGYLNRDVRLGMNLPMRLVPLFIKKFFISILCKVINRTVTSTVSNVGIINFEEKYKKDIDNVFVLVLPGRVQKIKCTICSFEGKLNVTINSNIDDHKFEERFYSLLKKKVKNIEVISNSDIDFDKIK